MHHDFMFFLPLLWIIFAGGFVWFCELTAWCVCRQGIYKHRDCWTYSYGMYPDTPRVVIGLYLAPCWGFGWNVSNIQHNEGFVFKGVSIETIRCGFFALSIERNGFMAQTFMMAHSRMFAFGWNVRRAYRYFNTLAIRHAVALADIADRRRIDPNSYKRELSGLLDFSDDIPTTYAPGTFVKLSTIHRAKGA